MAMATEAPDPRAFKSWEDAFQYPIPVVRKLEQQLRSSADENREKLRSLVGTSYRSLLDTAETIIDMEASMETVESKLAKVGRDCNSRSIDRIAGNAVKMDIHNKTRDLGRYTFASQLAVLRNAPTVMTRLMKVEGSYLLVAKVIVISRLLHKALSQLKDKPPIVDQLWEKLRLARSKLLRRIDKRLASSMGEMSSLVESMCAYALATSSTPTDVLNHFFKVRAEKIGGRVRQSGDELAKNGISSLKLCIQTCQDTQTIFPRRLAEALAKLKTQPLVQDPDVRGLYELNLDIHDRWLGDETRNYTPWPRHDELQRADAEKLLHQWSKKTISTFLKEIKSALEKEERLDEVANLRQELIETWILSGSRMAGVKSANVLDDLRDTMNEKLEAIVRSRTAGLKDVVVGLTDRLEKHPSRGDESILSLWTTIPEGTDFSDGAVRFKTAILNTHQGRDASVIDIVSAFDKWMKSVLEVKGIVKSMKEARWEDTFADDLEEDSDDDFGESKQTLLSDDDPRLLEEATQEALSETMQNLGRSFSKIISQPSEEKGHESVQKAIFILRVVREIGDRIPRLRLQEKSTPLATPFTIDLLKPLYTTIASQTIQSSIEGYKKSFNKAANARSNSHILWEGHPPVPAQPSPSAFRYLRDLNKSMRSLGSDLWAPVAVSTLKDMVCEEVARVFHEGLNIMDEDVQDDNKESEEPEDLTKVTTDEATPKTNGTGVSSLKETKDQKLKQVLFDMLYIQRFVGRGNGDDDKIGQLVTKAVGESLDESTKNRVKKNAADYAKKTYLLFALLA